MEIVLQPCRVRSDVLVPQKGVPPLTLDWTGLTELLLSHHSPERAASVGAAGHLSRLKVGSFVGRVVPREAAPSARALFVYSNVGGGGDLQAALALDTTFAERIQEAYRVESVRYDEVNVQLFAEEAE